MSIYRAPVRELSFLINEIAGLNEIRELPGFEDATPELVDSVLEECARFAQEVIAPLNRTGDRQGCRLTTHGVATADGWRAAYRAYCDAGWNGVTAPAPYGGQGLPGVVGLAVREMTAAANLSFSLCPMLTVGAIEALLTCASQTLRSLYLQPMVAGTWTGTMNLTEPQAGSDLASVATRAEPQPDGSYRIFGQKIFITYGDHDLTENIVHLVLARCPDAPPGVKGISLFLVPKILVNPDGTLGAPNDVRCASVEHKLGIHASPTCVMMFGEREGATGYLLGEAHRGLEYMFIMMNEARMGVGLQGIGVAERAYQQALAYARDRKQGRDAETGRRLVTIDRHPDVRRMLMTMKSRIEALRALTMYAAGLLDRAHGNREEAARLRYRQLAEFLIPLVKGGGTEMAVDVSSLGIQVHGGMGYIEETGAAQHWRDARITTIYEGTTGIQGNDLVVRKLLRDGGDTARAIFAQVRESASELEASDRPQLQEIGQHIVAALEAWEAATDWILTRARDAPAEVLAAAVPYLALSVAVAGGWQLGRAAAAAARRLDRSRGDPSFDGAKIATARYYAASQLPQASALSAVVRQAGPALAAVGDEALG